MQKLKFNLSRGFTLIELLVVIAIIGILAGIIVASLGGSRTKAMDTKVKGQLHGLRQQAELVNSDYGAYGVADITNTTCANEADTLLGDDKVQELLTSMPTNTVLKCAVTATTHANYAVAASLAAEGAGDFWCVDSMAYEGKITITDPDAVTIDDDSCVIMDSRDL